MDTEEKSTLSEKDLDNLEWARDFMNWYESKNKLMKEPPKNGC